MAIEMNLVKPALFLNSGGRKQLSVYMVRINVGQTNCHITMHYPEFNVEFATSCTLQQITSYS